jgi:hypothetical protein
MKLSAVKKPALTIIRIVSFLLLLLSGTVSLGAGEDTAVTSDEIVAELKTKLNLDEQQQKDLTAALTELAMKLDGLIAKREAAKEEEEPDAFINGVKQAQADYQEKLEAILSAQQLDDYNALREKVIMDMMKDLAEIRLLDIQPDVRFSDEQLEKLVPVLAESMRGFIKIAWEHAGKRLRVGQKIRVARDLKRIQSKAQQQVQETLTGEQLNKWEELKKQQQAK